MSLRFRRSVKIAPGLRLNVSKSGLGMSLGVRGAGISVGPRGKRVHAGIPGTGLSLVQRVGDAPRSGAAGRNKVGLEVSIHVDDDTGEVSFRDTDGGPLPPDIERAAKRQTKDRVQEILEKRADEINSQLHRLENVHLLTPKPDDAPEFKALPFPAQEPATPKLEAVGLLGRLFPWVRRRREARNKQRQSHYETATADWQRGRDQHEASERERHARFEGVVAGNPEAMEATLTERLAALDWPYETLVSFDVLGPGELALDVDLPEIEDLPVREAAVAARGNKLNIKAIADKRKRLLYLEPAWESRRLRGLSQATMADSSCR